MNPYRVLGIPEEIDDDEAIRNAWLEGVRRFPPEKQPEQFARNREAYEMIRDRESRFRLQTFGDPRFRDTDALVDFFPADRNHAGPGPWLAVIRGGTPPQATIVPEPWATSAAGRAGRGGTR